MKNLTWLRERILVKKGGAASSSNWFRDSVIRTILFSTGFWLITICFAEEFVRALKWLRARLKRSSLRGVKNLGGLIKERFFAGLE